MPHYIIYFHQQWVGDHDEEWFRSRVEPSTAVVREMEEAGVLVFAGGLVEDMDQAFSADGTSGAMVVSDGPYTETTEQLGGITVIEVPDQGITPVTIASTITSRLRGSVAACRPLNRSRRVRTIPAARSFSRTVRLNISSVRAGDPPPRKLASASSAHRRVDASG